MCKIYRILIAALAAALLGSTAAAQGRHDEKPHGMTKPAPAEQVKVPAGGIPLKDGGTLIVGKDGVTYHLDAAGKRVRMRDGQVMEATDGTRYVMRNDAVWRTIIEKGTLRPAQ